MAAQRAPLLEEARLELRRDMLRIRRAPAVSEDEDRLPGLEDLRQRRPHLLDQRRVPLEQQQLDEGTLGEAVLDFLAHVHSCRILRMISEVEIPFTSGASSTRPACRRPTTSFPL